MTPEVATPSTRQKGGRPGDPNTLVISVRLPEHVYDAYIKTARRHDVDVRTVMRRILTVHAPKA